MSVAGDTYARLQAAVEAIRQRSDLQPRLGIVLGSGLGPLAEEVTGIAVPYTEIPHFPRSTVHGHAGKLALGELRGVPVVVMSGRVHLYEGYAPEEVVFPTRTMRMLGAETLLITNAAGGVNPDFHAGTLMLITDQVNMTGRNPLIGPNDDRLGERFPDMSEAYNRELRELALRVAGENGAQLAQGVYMGLPGPSFETPAEIRMARALGADAVGMSTVMEVVAAKHMGMKVLGISLITNMAAGILPQRQTGEEVYETARLAQGEFTGLVRDLVAAYGAAV